MKDIVILGGGTSGWMSACYFHAKGGYNITVIESPDFKPIEMSASTTPYLKRFFKDIGIEDEKEWMPHCMATYKLGVLYDDFNYIGSRMWNTFEGEEDWHCYWNKQRLEEDLPSSDFYLSRIYSSHIGMNDLGKFLMNKDGEMGYPYAPKKSWGGHPEPWAYNIDSGLLNKFLKNRVIQDVNFVKTTIEEIHKDEEGIKFLLGDNGQKYSADLFIDCTGGKGMLIKEVSPEGKIPLTPYLTHDKAIVVDVDYTDVESQMCPRTGAKALSSGWMWDIPLYDRIVNGYVYSSEFITPEEAEKELLSNVKGVPRTKSINHMNIQTGHYARPWSKNVIAIGMSAGFIEPMEATLLMIVQFLLVNIHEVFYGRMTKEECNDKYEYTLFDTLDWISTQYYMSERQDSDFWRFKSKNKSQIRKRMIDWLEDCKKAILPPEEDILFYPTCWYAKLIGFEYYPDGDGFPEEENKTLPTYSDSNFKPQNKFKFKEMDYLNAKIQMDKIRNFDVESLISQKEYLDKFIYNKE